MPASSAPFLAATKTGISPSTEALPHALAGFASLTVAAFPALFAEFRAQCLTLLWRGCRDGFGAGDFHSRCDGHTRTLALIQDTEGSAFGDFTPVEWDSSGDWKANPSMKSFVGTLKNRHNFPARRNALKAEENKQ
jgi:hypothetical protein